MFWMLPSLVGSGVCLYREYKFKVEGSVQLTSSLWELSNRTEQVSRVVIYTKPSPSVRVPWFVSSPFICVIMSWLEEMYVCTEKTNLKGRLSTDDLLIRVTKQQT